MLMRTIVNVTAAASSYDLATLAIVKSDNGITISTDDALLSRLITRASAAIANYCDRVIPAETVAETFFISEWDSCYTRWDSCYTSNISPLQMSRYPFGTITSVVEDGTTLTLTTDYVKDASRGYLYRVDTAGIIIPWNCDKVVVTYVGGYNPIPLAFEEACSRIVWTRYAARGRDLTLRRERVYSVAELEYYQNIDDTSFDAGVQALLAPYCVPVII